MRLSLEGREFLTFTVTDTSAGTLEVSFDDEVTWHELDVQDETTARCLVQGPLADDEEPDAIPLDAGSHEIHLRLIIGPEIIVRFAPDRIDVE